MYTTGFAAPNRMCNPQCCIRPILCTKSLFCTHGYTCLHKTANKGDVRSICVMTLSQRDRTLLDIHVLRGSVCDSQET
jgi:hypothetical protein